MLEFAILGLLNQAPMHGYELRKELASVVGGQQRPRRRLVAGDQAGGVHALQGRIERAVGDAAPPAQDGGELLAQLVAVHGRLVQQPQDGELEHRVTSLSAGRSIGTIHPRV